MKKYSLTKNTKQWCGVTLFQIKAEISFGSVSKGDLGGYIEKEENLSQENDAWVSGNSEVSGDAKVYGNSRVYGNAWVYGNSEVYGNAWVSGNSEVYGNAWVSGNARVYAKANFTKGWFIGGDDTGKITNITDKTGSTYWENQYVLGDYEITPIEEETDKVKITCEGKEVEISRESAKALNLTN